MHADSGSGALVAKALGAEGTREFLTKGAGLIRPIEQLILERVASASC